MEMATIHPTYDEIDVELYGVSNTVVKAFVPKLDWTPTKESTHDHLNEVFDFCYRVAKFSIQTDLDHYSIHSSEIKPNLQMALFNHYRPRFDELKSQV